MGRNDGHVCRMPWGHRAGHLISPGASGSLLEAVMSELSFEGLKGDTKRMRGVQLGPRVQLAHEWDAGRGA